MTQPWTLDAAATRRRTWTPLVVTQLVVVLAVLVSGVTGAGILRGRDGGDVLQVVQAASTSAQRQHTFRTTYSFTLAGSGVNLEAKGELLVDTVRRISVGSIEAPGLGSVNILSSGADGYVQLPGGKADAAGHHWVSIVSPNGGAESAVGAQDPLAFLKLLGEPKDVRKVGTEKVNGTPTTHYSVALDPRRLTDAVAKAQSAAIPPGLLDSVKDSSLDVWVDRQNLPRRLRLALTIQQIKAGFTFEYRDFGGAVDVTVPPASDVTRVGSPQELGPYLVALRNG